MIEFGIAREDDIKEIFNILKSLLNKIIRIFQNNKDNSDQALGIKSKQLLDKTGIQINSILTLILMCGIDSKTNFTLMHLRTLLESNKSIIEQIKQLFFVPLSGNKVVTQILLEN